MPTVFHSGNDAKESMARGMVCIKAERKRKREAEYEAMRAVRRGGPSGVVRRLSMNQ